MRRQASASRLGGPWLSRACCALAAAGARLGLFRAMVARKPLAPSQPLLRILICGAVPGLDAAPGGSVQQAWLGREGLEPGIAPAGVNPHPLPPVTLPCSMRSLFPRTRRSSPAGPSPFELAAAPCVRRAATQACTRAAAVRALRAGRTSRTQAAAQWGRCCVCVQLFLCTPPKFFLRQPGEALGPAIGS